MPMKRRAQRRILRDVSDWWEEDRNRLVVIRVIAYTLFLLSVVGTVYSGVNGDLPPWALSLYVAFAIQLIFMTFMYAIRHSVEQDLERSMFQLRSQRIGQWSAERHLMAELARHSACVAAGVDPQEPQLGVRATRRSKKNLTPWPVADSAQVVCGAVRKAVTERLSSSGQRQAVEPITIDFIAYSAETLINLSREILVEMEEIRSENGHAEVPLRVRILVRDTSDEATWLVPLARDEQRDVEYFDDLRVRFRNVQNSALGEFADGLANIVTARNLEFRARGYATEPFLKGLVVDRTCGVFGIYTVDDLKNPEGWDYSGHGVPLCRAAIDGNFYERLGLAAFSATFDELWDDRNLCRNLDL